MTFAEARPKLDKGRQFSTTATFSAPGEYIVASPGERSIGRRRRRVPVLLDEHARQGDNRRSHVEELRNCVMVMSN